MNTVVFQQNITKMSILAIYNAMLSVSIANKICQTCYEEIFWWLGSYNSLDPCLEEWIRKRDTTKVSTSLNLTISSVIHRTLSLATERFCKPSFMWFSFFYLLSLPYSSLSILVLSNCDLKPVG